MTAPGIYVRGATTALTRRTVLRKAFLAPWHPLVEHFALWFLAKAQERAAVAIHASHFVVSHHHTSITPSDKDGLATFMRVFHGELSKALNALLARERYDTPREVFDDRSTHRLRLLDAAAQASHHVYEVNNTVAAGLVSNSASMPGVKLSHHHWRSGPIVVKRPPFYVDPKTNPDHMLLELSPPPELYRAFGGDMDALVHHLDRLVEHGRAQIRSARKKHAAPLGAKEVTRIHPWSEPRTLREARGRRVPTFKVGARDVAGRRVSRDAARDTKRFRALHREVRIARRDGDTTRAYPYGTYKARVHEGAPVEDGPLEGAVVTAPGATLDEVKAELAQQGADGKTNLEARHALLDEVRAAFEEEANEVVSEESVELLRRTSHSAPPAQSDERGVAVRRRADPRPRDHGRPSRIVVLRDARRGRPKSTVKRGSDPPD